jgi:dienelactone hydrolase
MTRATRCARWLAEGLDRAFAWAGEWRPAVRLGEWLVREEPWPGNSPDREAPDIPSLGYRPARVAPGPVPMQRDGPIRRAEVAWKLCGPAGERRLGYLGTGGFYLPAQPASVPLAGLLVPPVLYDPLHLAVGSLARYLARRGFAVLELRGGPSFLGRVRVEPQGVGPTWDEVVAAMIVDGRLALDWLCARDEVDPGRLGIVGVSHGAIVGPCVMGADRRLRAGVFCMGGGDERLLVARSREWTVRRFRRRLMRARGLRAPEQLLGAGGEPLSRTDPLRYAPAVDPQQILVVKTRRDRAVPPEAQDKLWEALGRPHRISVPLGHLGFGLVYPVIARRAAAFLHEQLGASGHE